MVNSTSGDSAAEHDAMMITWVTLVYCFIIITVCECLLTTLYKLVTTEPGGGECDVHENMWNGIRWCCLKRIPKSVGSDH